MCCMNQEEEGGKTGYRLFCGGDVAVETHFTYEQIYLQGSVASLEGCAWRHVAGSVWIQDRLQRPPHCDLENLAPCI